MATAITSVSRPRSLSDYANEIAERQQVWAKPDITSHALVVLTPTRLCLVPLSVNLRSSVALGLSAGGDVDATLGPTMQIVDLRTVQRTIIELSNYTIRLETRVDGVMEEIVIVFAKAETADDAFNRFWSRLGNNFDLVPYNPDFWTLSRAPLMSILGVAAATAMVAMTLSVLEDTRGIVTGVDWRWVCGFGGGVIAALQIWLYRLLTSPPARLELLRR